MEMAQCRNPEDIEHATTATRAEWQRQALTVPRAVALQARGRSLTKGGEIVLAATRPQSEWSWFQG
jgi:hypothetical protein